MLPDWVRPKLLAEVSFAGWIRDSPVRQAVFHGLAEDRPARRIVREVPAQPAGNGADDPMNKVRRSGRASHRGVRITHAERVIDEQRGITKGDLVGYYARVGELMLPHLVDRPVALLRAPRGVTGEKFFQKHAEEGSLPGVESLPPQLDPGHKPLLVVPAAEALVQMAQMNVVELHTWNATRHALETPDRLVFDLDPGEGVEWKQLVEGAMLLHQLLDGLGLASFVKTSGGRGLHVVLPLKPELGWAETSRFSAAVVRHLARVLPQHFVARSGPKNRVGRIFADYLRNTRGATTVAAWSARARPGMSISVPLSWEELPGLTRRPSWNVLDPGERLAIGNRPWKDYERSRRSLRDAIEALARIAASNGGD
jgi:bifunctional non-homologous end joining protein LigD